MKNAKGEIKEEDVGRFETERHQALRSHRGFVVRGVPAQTVYALGIPNIGAHTAKVLANHYGTLEALRKAASAAVKGGPESLAHAALTHIDGADRFFGRSRWSISGGPANASIVDEILAHGVVVIPVDAKSSTERTARRLHPPNLPPAGGGRSTSSGTPAPSMVANDIHALIERNNGIVASSISAPPPSSSPAPPPVRDDSPRRASSTFQRWPPSVPADPVAAAGALTPPIFPLSSHPRVHDAL